MRRTGHGIRIARSTDARVLRKCIEHEITRSLSMAEITAAMVKTLRDETRPADDGLQEGLAGDGRRLWKPPSSNLRKAGKKIMGKRQDRTTEDGRIGVYASIKPRRRRDGRAAVRVGPRRQATKSSSHWPTTWPSNWPPAPAPRRPRSCGRSRRRAARARRCEDRKDDLENKIREVFRMARIDAHRRAQPAATSTTTQDRRAAGSRGRQRRAGQGRRMHVAAMKPQGDHQGGARSRRSSTRSARSSPSRPGKEGKPENIIDKMIEGRMRNFYAEHVLGRAAVREGRQADGRQDRQSRRDEAEEVHPLAVGRNTAAAEDSQA